MTAKLDKDDAKHLLDVLASDPQMRMAETKTLELLAKSGGETVIYPEKMRPVAVAVLRIMQAKGLITADVASSQLEIMQRSRIRLTEHGRKLASYLEQLSANQVQQADSLSLEQLQQIATEGPR